MREEIKFFMVHPHKQSIMGNLGSYCEIYKNGIVIDIIKDVKTIDEAKAKLAKKDVKTVEEAKAKLAKIGAK